MTSPLADWKLQVLPEVIFANEKSISVGSAVQVHDETPRSSWKLAVVVSSGRRGVCQGKRWTGAISKNSCWK
ncbi:hypothetical protein DPMN_068613 [Dreissena polymorpha]|uniref:DUF5641 domain-containing protein n=1 Tax=Dreissena polymorpha TaxID=45954 RepID=A0A9D3Z2K0_DREPO|nr:hypothetical protein DPMN_068613 [Dreissena polymorpha]